MQEEQSSRGATASLEAPALSSISKLSKTEHAVEHCPVSFLGNCCLGPTTAKHHRDDWEKQRLFCVWGKYGVSAFLLPVLPPPCTSPQSGSESPSAEIITPASLPRQWFPIKTPSPQLHKTPSQIPCTSSRINGVTGVHGWCPYSWRKVEYWREKPWVSLQLCEHTVSATERTDWRAGKCHCMYDWPTFPIIWEEKGQLVAWPSGEESSCWCRSCLGAGTEARTWTQPHLTPALQKLQSFPDGQNGEIAGHDLWCCFRGMDQYSWHGEVAQDEAERHCHGEGWQHRVAC